MNILTVCIPTFNSAKFLGNIIQDLRNQTFRSFVVYFADGGSNDDTLSLIESCGLDYQLVSKQDNSAEEGINKCLAKIDTVYFIIIGSDDRIPPIFFEKLILAANTTNADFIFPMLSVNGVIQPFKDSFSKLKYKMISPGIGWIAKKTVLNHLPEFTLRYSVATDYDFLCRAHKIGMNFYRLSDVAYEFSLGGNSVINKFKGFKEVRDISIENGCPQTFAYTYYLLRIIFHKLKNIILGKFF